ncbi:acyltransferase [Brevundimonas sp. Leaf363]|uniref:acyltransferase family protein n=1 Tax=Brevundimonas sp. Leaf363 TaxID=1736353 RepID=UPI000AB03A45|nr:acyltransferase [Brevundimonas sp. Leaf363]
MTEAAVATAARPDSKTRGGALDALRFVAALFVVIFHFGDQAPIALSSIHGFLGRGYLATDFFLMLSGFVLAKAYGSAVASGRVSLGRFWSKRFVRCYPTHIITLAMLVAMVLVGSLIGVQSDHAGRFNFSGIPAQIFLLHAFGLGGGHWNIPSWTISTLLLCYAFFPMLWRRMLKIDSPVLALSVGLLILGVSNVASQALFGTEQFNLPFQWCLFRAAPLFLVGLTLARAVQTARWSGGEARIIGFTGGAVLLTNAAFVGPDIVNILAICAIIIGCGASPVTRALPGAEWGAKVSFCLFMVHTITGAVWYDVIAPLTARVLPAFDQGALAWLLWSGGVAFAVLGAAIYNHWIDEPIQRWLNGRLFAPRTPRTAAQPA